MSTNLLVASGADSCYPASIVNFIWFTDEKCLFCQHACITSWFLLQ